MFHEYPYSDFHEINLDYILKLCRESVGLRLKVVDKKLQLVNDLGQTLSNVTISFATSAAKDDKGNAITTYIISSGTENDKLVLTHGDGTVDMITIPYARKASTDVNGKDLTTYLSRVQVVGDALRITQGDGTTYDITVPYAIKALTDTEGKDIKTYAANLATDGDELVLTDGLGRTLARFKVQYAEKANRDVDGDEIKSTYGHKLTTGARTIKLVAKDGTILEEITVPYATMASIDEDGNAFLSDYVEKLEVISDTTIGVKAHDGTKLSEITVPFATLSTDATNAVERVEIVGDQIRFTTYGGVNTELTIPYAIRCKNDNLNNEITKSYVASVTNDPASGEITFYDKEGNVLAQLVPTVKTAENDTYGNLIADYVKTIVVTDDSNYVTVTHGTGNVDTLTINYSTHAFKDSLENIIHNTYVAFLTMVNDEETGEPWMVAYNGEKSEIFRFQVAAVSAMKDHLGNVIADTYGHELAYEDGDLSLLSASGEELSRVSIGGAGGANLKSKVLRYRSNLPDDPYGETENAVLTFKKCYDATMQASGYWYFETLDREIVYDDDRAYYARKNDFALYLPVNIKTFSSIDAGETKSVILDDYVRIVGKIGAYNTILDHNAPTPYATSGSVTLNSLAVYLNTSGVAQYGLLVEPKFYLTSSNVYKLKIDITNITDATIEMPFGVNIALCLPVGPYRDIDRYVNFNADDPAIIDFTWDRGTGDCHITALNATSYKCTKIEMSMSGSLRETLVDENDTGDFTTTYMGGNTFIYKFEVSNLISSKTDYIYIGCFV